MRRPILLAMVVAVGTLQGRGESRELLETDIRKDITTFENREHDLVKNFARKHAIDYKEIEKIAGGAEPSGKVNEALQQKLNPIVERVFDQYRGLRQIKDFRGFQPMGEMIAQDGFEVVSELSSRVKALASLLVRRDVAKAPKEEVHEGFVVMALPVSDENVTQDFAALADALLKEYDTFKSAVLKRTKMMSSRQLAREGNIFTAWWYQLFPAAKESYQYDQAQELKARLEESVAQQEQRVAQAIHAQGYTKIPATIAESLNEFRTNQLRWINVSVQSFADIELFGKSEEELKQRLRKEKERIQTQGVQMFEMLADNIFEEAGVVPMEL